jgi:hypothetical protein
MSAIPVGYSSRKVLSSTTRQDDVVDPVSGRPAAGDPASKELKSSPDRFVTALPGVGGSREVVPPDGLEALVATRKYPGVEVLRRLEWVEERSSTEAGTTASHSFLALWSPNALRAARHFRSLLPAGIPTPDADILEEKDEAGWLWDLEDFFASVRFTSAGLIAWYASRAGEQIGYGAEAFTGKIPDGLLSALSLMTRER